MLVGASSVWLTLWVPYFERVAHLESGEMCRVGDSVGAIGGSLASSLFRGEASS